jgi:hypothetical protein
MMREKALVLVVEPNDVQKRDFAGGNKRLVVDLST